MMPVVMAWPTAAAVRITSDSRILAGRGPAAPTECTVEPRSTRQPRAAAPTWLVVDIEF